MPQKQFIINTISTVLNLLIQMAISFFLTSYLIRSIGSTAYGFYGMANSIVNYALIVTNALNSMAARFIGYEIHNENREKAQRYFSSVFFGDLVFALVIFLPTVVAIWNLEGLINIPDDLIKDVKYLFFIVFANMCCNMICAVFGCVYTIKNRLDIQSILSIISNIVKAGLLVFLYVKFVPSIVYLGVATLVATIILSISNIHFTRKILPDIKVSISLVSLKSIKEIVLSGIWNSLNQLSFTLLHGLDLLLANLMVCAESMGVLSLAGTIPGVISMCINSLANLFTPNLLKYFSKQQYDLLLHEIKNSIRFMTVISCVPISFLIAFGVPFFKLWTPGTDIKMLYILSILVILPQFSGGAICSMNYLYTVANRVKWQSIVLLCTGLLNVGIVYFLLKFTDLGVYAIVMVSAIIGFFRNFLFNAPYAAHCIKQKISVFWPDMFKSLLVLICCSAVGLVINYLTDCSTWSSLILIGGAYCVISCLATSMVLLNKTQRRFLVEKIFRRNHES